MKYTTVKLSCRVVEKMAYLKKKNRHKSYDDLLREKLNIGKEDAPDKKREYGCHVCKNPVYKGQRHCDKCGATFIWD